MPSFELPSSSLDLPPISPESKPPGSPSMVYSEARDSGRIFIGGESDFKTHHEEVSGLQNEKLENARLKFVDPFLETIASANECLAVMDRVRSGDDLLKSTQEFDSLTKDFLAGGLKITTAVELDFRLKNLVLKAKIEKALNMEGLRDRLKELNDVNSIHSKIKEIRLNVDFSSPVYSFIKKIINELEENISTSAGDLGKRRHLLEQLNQFVEYSTNEVEEPTMRFVPQDIEPTRRFGEQNRNESISLSKEDILSDEPGHFNGVFENAFFLKKDGKRINLLDIVYNNGESVAESINEDIDSIHFSALEQSAFQHAKWVVPLIVSELSDDSDRSNFVESFREYSESLLVRLTGFEKNGIPIPESLRNIFDAPAKTLKSELLNYPTRDSIARLLGGFNPHDSIKSILYAVEYIEDRFNSLESDSKIIEGVDAWMDNNPDEGVNNIISSRLRLLKGEISGTFNENTLHNLRDARDILNVFLYSNIKIIPIEQSYKNIEALVIKQYRKESEETRLNLEFKKGLEYSNDEVIMSQLPDRLRDSMISLYQEHLSILESSALSKRHEASYRIVSYLNNRVVNRRRDAGLLAGCELYIDIINSTLADSIKNIEKKQVIQRLERLYKPSDDLRSYVNRLTSEKISFNTSLNSIDLSNKSIENLTDSRNTIENLLREVKVKYIEIVNSPLWDDFSYRQNITRAKLARYARFGNAEAPIPSTERSVLQPRPVSKPEPKPEIYSNDPSLPHNMETVDASTLVGVNKKPGLETVLPTPKREAPASNRIPSDYLFDQLETLNKSDSNEVIETLFGNMDNIWVGLQTLMIKEDVDKAVSFINDIVTIKKALSKNELLTFSKEVGDKKYAYEVLYLNHSNKDSNTLPSVSITINEFEGLMMKTRTIGLFNNYQFNIAPNILELISGFAKSVS